MQLCTWHAAEAIKKRLITAGGYPKEIRRELETLIWNWIKSTTIEQLAENRQKLLNRLHSDEKVSRSFQFNENKNSNSQQEYLVSYYKQQEPQFVVAYTRRFPNLGAISTQRVESKHTMVKSVTNRHTSMKILVEKICTEVKNEQIEQEIEINKQRITNPRLIDRDFFKNLTGLITHQAIDLMSQELDAAKKIAEELLYGIASIVEPTGEGCVHDCKMPLRYGLPCKCWLYDCVVGYTPIPISLIHPRWFFNGPFVVLSSWRMTLDYQLNFKDMLNLARAGRTQEEENEVEEPTEISVPKISSETGDWFCRSGLDLLHSAAYEAIDFHKSIEDAHRGEEYARDYARVMKKFNKKWEQKELARSFLSTTFPDEIQPQKNLTYKKEGSQRRAYTGREAAEVAEAEQRRV